MTRLKAKLIFVTLVWTVARAQRTPPWRQQVVEARSFETAKEVGGVEDDLQAYISPISVRHGMYLKVWAEPGQSIEAYVYRSPKETSFQAELVLVAPLDPQGLNLIVGNSRQTAGTGFTRYGTNRPLEEQFGWPAWEAPVLEWFTTVTTTTSTLAPADNVSNSILGGGNLTNNSRLLRAVQGMIPARKAIYMYKSWGSCSGLLDSPNEICYEPEGVADAFLPRAVSVLATGTHVAQVAGWHYWIVADLRHTTRACQLREDPASNFLIAGQSEACGLPVAVAVGPGAQWGFVELLELPLLGIPIHVWEGHSVLLLIMLPTAAGCLSLLWMRQLDLRWRKRGEGFLGGVVLGDALLGGSVALYIAAMMYRWIVTFSLFGSGQVPVFQATIMFFINSMMSLIIAAPYGHWKYFRLQLEWSNQKRGTLALLAFGGLLFFGTGMYVAPALSFIAALLPLHVLVVRIDCIGPTDILKCLQRCCRIRNGPARPLPPPGDRIREAPKILAEEKTSPPPPLRPEEPRPPPPIGAPPEGIGQIRSGGAFPGLTSNTTSDVQIRHPSPPKPAKVKHGLEPVSVTDLWKQNEALKEENRRLRAAAEGLTPQGTSNVDGTEAPEHASGGQKIGEETKFPPLNLAPRVAPRMPPTPPPPPSPGPPTPPPPGPQVVGTPQKPGRPFIPKLKLPLPQAARSMTPPKLKIPAGPEPPPSESEGSSECSTPRPPLSPEEPPMMLQRANPPAPPSWKVGDPGSPQAPATPRSADGVVFMCAPSGEDPFNIEAPPTPQDADGAFSMGLEASLGNPPETAVPTDLPPPPPQRPPRPMAPLDIARKLSGLPPATSSGGASTPNRVATPPLTPTTSGLGLSLAQRRDN